MDANYLKARLDQTRQRQLQSSNKPQMPSLGRMAVNATQSVIRNAASVAQGNSLKLDPAEANKRLSICQGCEYFSSGSQRCQKCGCFLSVKTYLKAEKCPVGKW
jgi:hypothetical protein